MKRLIRTSEDIFAMSKIVNKYAIKDIINDIGEFVYFSPCLASHGPRIKFYGGTKETSSTKDSPTLAYDLDGNCEVEIADWMNKKNCPNAFDSKYVAKLERFVKKYKAILLLVWFNHLDESDALAYFHNQISFEELLNDCEFDLPEVADVSELDEYCKKANLYQF